MRALIGAALTVGTLTLAACAAPASTATPPTAPALPSATASSRPSEPAASAPPAVRTSPLTGRPQPSPAPVVVVKLDNTRNAQPHAGLERADVVYLEEVEYGITRIAAVFASDVPDRIGPVRSARVTDIELLAPFDRPAFVYSGAQRKLLPVIAASPLIERSPNQLASAFWRDRDRYAPYNLFVNGQEVLDATPKASTEPAMGWSFDPAVPPGGRPVTKASMRWREARASFRYDPETGGYAVSLNGERAEAEGIDAGQQAATVVIQLVKQDPSVYFDRYGANTPFAHTVGSGKAVVLRDGLAWDAQWNRPSPTSGTTYTLPDGSELALKPGQQWVVLLNEQTPAKLTRGSSAATPSVSASADAMADQAQ